MNFRPSNFFSSKIVRYAIVYCYANCYAKYMKEKITLDNWRFEYLKGRDPLQYELRVGGVIRESGFGFTDEVTVLQGHNKQPQFTEGFELETKSRIVVLGTKENF